MTNESSPIDNSDSADDAKDQQDAFEFLKTTGIFFGRDEEGDEKWDRMINLNDVWGWGCADCHEVPMEQMPELLRLYMHYGWCGVLYFVSQREGGHLSEFHHYSRMIEFVRHEETIRMRHESHSAYAYDKQSYMIGS